eukprot:6192369-Pleurochrysis_carterae.AAC.2
MQEGERGTRSSDNPRAAAKERSANHGTGRAGTATVKTVMSISASVSKAAELKTALKATRCPRARRRARTKSCSLEQRGSAKQ